MAFGERLAMPVLVAERYSGSQEVLRLCFVLSLSAGVETSEMALKGGNLDKAAWLRIWGAFSLRAPECHAFVYPRQGVCRPTLSTSPSSRAQHAIGINKC